MKKLIQALRKVTASISAEDNRKWMNSFDGKISQQALQNYVTIQNMDKEDIDALMYDLQKEGIAHLKRPKQARLNIPSNNKYHIDNVYMDTIAEDGSEQTVITFEFKVGEDDGLFQDDFSPHMIDRDELGTDSPNGDVVQWAATDFDIDLDKVLG